MYGPSGFLEDMPRLKVGRHNHACAGYFTDTQHFVLLVAGGLDDNTGSFLRKTLPEIVEIILCIILMI